MVTTVKNGGAGTSAAPDTLRADGYAPGSVSWPGSEAAGRPEEIRRRGGPGTPCPRPEPRPRGPRGEPPGLGPGGYF
jgi:hypothetical protein